MLPVKKKINWYFTCIHVDRQHTTGNGGQRIIDIAFKTHVTPSGVATATAQCS